MTSPGFPNNYGANSNCIFTISSDREAEVTISVIDFNIENDPNGCNWDATLIEFADGRDDSGRICGNNLDQTIFIGAAPVTITFTSDGGVQFAGFRMTYEIVVADPCLDEPCQNEATCQTSDTDDRGFECICTQFWQGKSFFYIRQSNPLNYEFLLLNETSYYLINS